MKWANLMVGRFFIQIRASLHSLYMFFSFLHVLSRVTQHLDFCCSYFLFCCVCFGSRFSSMVVKLNKGQIKSSYKPCVRHKFYSKLELVKILIYSITLTKTYYNCASFRVLSDSLYLKFVTYTSSMTIYETP